MNLGDNWYKLGAVLSGLGAAILAILAVAVFYGYFPSSLVANLTSGQLGTLAAVLVAAAVGLHYTGERRK